MMTDNCRADWIAVDWGTSSLRAWAMSGDVVIDARQSDDGMGRLGPGLFEPALTQLIDDWLGDQCLPVLACGMVGARQGWSEAAYRPVPCTPLGAPFHRIYPADRRFTVHIIPGLSQLDPADVMRGEETQIAGFLSSEPGFEGVLALPGTHSKWVTLRGGLVTGFRTVMTGEVFALLADQSVLRHGMGQGWCETAFAEGVNAAIERPADLPLALFPLRAEGLLKGLSPDAARARLSGLLIGAEIAATRPMWQGTPIALLGAGRLSQLYATALELAGAKARVTDGTALTLAGLTRAFRLLQERQ
jgi:2-dehydro-3-deoxygalactonokinase